MGAALVVACESEPFSPDTSEPAFAKAGASTADVFTLTVPPVQVEGSSRVTRNNNGVSATLHTSELVPGHAYTMWMVIFNEPAGCSGACGGDDLFNAAAVVDVVYVAGNVVGDAGTSTFSGRRSAGDNSGSVFAAVGLPAPGLIDPFAAEVHLVVRDHGEAIPGQVPAQINTFEGACTVESSFRLGDGSYPCLDVQFSVHLP